MSSIKQPCPLCEEVGGPILWQSAACRVVRVDDANYPGFCRVIWTAHVREMTDLDTAQRGKLMTVVFAVETMIRELLSPEKINLASFGNVVPHLHWHVVQRWADDRHFPEPVWGTKQRDGNPVRNTVGNETMREVLNRILGSEA